MRMRHPLGLVATICVVVIAFAAIAAPGARLTTAQPASPAASPAGGDSIEILGLVDTPGVVTVAELQSLSTQTIEVDFQSETGDVEHHSYTGVLLWDVLDRAGIQIDPTHENDKLHKYVVLREWDGYEVIFSLGEIDPEFGNKPYLLAWEEDGRQLTGDLGPVQMVVPGDVTAGRYIYGIVSIEVRDIDIEPSR